MTNIAGDTIQISRPERGGLSSNRKLDLTGDNDPHLLMRVGMFFDHGTGFKRNDARHDPFEPARFNRDTRENLVLGTIRGLVEVFPHWFASVSG